MAEPVRQQDDADALSLLQTKAVVSRKAQDELHVKTDIKNEWGLGGMLSSVVEAVHGAFQGDPNPADGKQALQLMEAEKTVVVANTTARGVLHLVHGCNQCGFHFCEKASIKESKTGIEKSYLVGSALSEWGCDKVVNPYVVHDKGTRKVYAVEFIEAQSEEASAIQKHSEAKAVDSKKETSEEKASKIGVKDNVKSKGRDKSQSSEAHAKYVHAEKLSDVTSVDSTSKSKWPDFSLPHLEAKDKVTEKVPRTAAAHRHSEEKHSKSGTNSADEEKTILDEDGAQAKQTKSKGRQSKLSSDDSNSADSKEAKKDKISSAKSLKSDKLATEAKHDSMLMEHGVAIAEKDNLPKLKNPHMIQEVEEKAGERVSSKVSEDKKSIKDKSTHIKESNLAAGSKEKEEKEEFSSAKSVKFDKHEPKTSQHPHDQEVAEKAGERISSKVSEDKKSIKDKPTHIKESKLAAESKENKKEEKEEYSSAKSEKSDKHEPKTSQHPHDQEVAEKAGERISSKVSEDKKLIKDKSTHIKESKLAVESKEIKKEENEEYSSAKSVKSDKHEPKTSQHPRDQEVAEKAGERISRKKSEDKKSIKDKSTHIDDSKLAAKSKENKKEEMEEYSSAKSVKSDEHEPKTSQHDHDSMLLEHGKATIEKEDFPNLKIPHVIQKLAEKAEEKMTRKVSEDKSAVEDKAIAHAKDSKLAASKDHTAERRHAHEEVTSEHSSAKSVMSDKQEAKTSNHEAKEPKTSNHKAKASATNEGHAAK